MLRSLPPVGLPLVLSDLAAGLRGWASGAAALNCFRELLMDRLGVRYCFLLSSGRAALTLILTCLKHLAPHRDEVVIPGYTCYSVPSAVTRAGLRIVPCDIDVSTLDFDEESLEKAISERTLCVVPVYLFGFPGRLDRVLRAASAHGAFVIEDASQAFSAGVDGRAAGTLSDVGFYSLGRGKVFSTGEGGVIVTNSAAIAAEVVKFPLVPSRWWQPVDILASMAFQGLFIAPSWFWLAERLPFGKMGVSEFSTKYPLGCFSPFQAGFGASVIKRLEKVNCIRQKNARYLIAALEGMDGVEVPQMIPRIEPVFLRLPIFLNGGAERNRLFDALRRRNLGASRMYPAAVTQIPEAQPHLVPGAACPLAEDLAQRILTLPTHPLVSPQDLEEIIQCVRESL